MPPCRTRRATLAGVVGSVIAVTGCLAGRIDGPKQPETPTTEPPGVENVSTTKQYDGTTVPLVAAEDAYNWFTGDIATFADTRRNKVYEKRRIDGAVWSPESTEDIPTATDTLAAARHIVVYGAPETDGPLRRAASLLTDGFDSVFVLEGGLRAWQRADYPLAGTAIE